MQLTAFDWWDKIVHMQKPTDKLDFIFALLLLLSAVFAAPAFTQENTTAKSPAQEEPSETPAPVLSGKDNLIVSGNIGAGIGEPKQRIDAEGYVRASEGLCIGDDCKKSWPKLKCSDYKDRPAEETGDSFCNSKNQLCFSVFMGTGAGFSNECSVLPQQKHDTRCCWVE